MHIFFISTLTLFYEPLYYIEKEPEVGWICLLSKILNNLKMLNCRNITEINSSSLDPDSEVSTKLLINSTPDKRYFTES